ncbi:winged helix-turn-helix domain-containing protein [Paraburkholderia sediminicola]|uniref:ATP-binding protein n=1 Tax=Paraburkholderia sediminicola TaxID=458836 RepID=UPI0038B80D58
MDDNSLKSLQFGRFEVTPATRELRLDGIPVHLGDRAFDILLFLVGSNGRIVRKLDLMEAVWPGRIVEENSLEAQISILRRALGPERGCIRTIAGRGYKFIAPMGVLVHEVPVRGVVRLPSSISRLIGRQQSIDSLSSMLLANRLVTLVGPGGIGKTRLAIELARQMAHDFAQNVCMAELAPIVEPQFVSQAVATALGLAPADTRALPERVSTQLGTSPCLLVLDNCEHVIGASAEIVRTLLEASPGLHVIATSREALRIAGEFSFNVPALAVPDVRECDVASAMASSAMQLFNARLSYGQSGMADDAHSVTLKAQICRRLDGIPLAIELAAARVQVFGVAGVSERLENLFELLTGGARTALPRQQTLAATLDWSYELLPEQERVVLSRLSVFADKFSLRAAQAVVADADVTSEGVLDCIINLVAKSLISPDTADPEARYRLLDMTRAYARKKLEARAEARTFFGRYAKYLCQRFQTAHALRESGNDMRWTADYEIAIKDLRAAIGWCFSEDGDVGLGIDLTVAVVPYWFEDSLVEDCLANVTRALEFINVTGRTGLKSEMKLQAALGKMLLFASHASEQAAILPDAGVAFARALSIAEQFEDVEYQQISLWGLCAFTYLCGPSDRFAEFARRFRDLCAALPGQRDLWVGERVLATAYYCSGDLQKGQIGLQRMLRAYRHSGSNSHLVRFNFDQIVVAQVTLARLCWLSGQPLQATELIDEAMARSDELGHDATQWYVFMLGTLPISLLTEGIAGLEYPLQLMGQKGRQFGASIWETRGRFWQGLVCLWRGVPNAYQKLIVPSLNALGAASQAPFLTGYLSSLCSELVKRGAHSEACELSGAWLARAQRNRGHISLPELLRVRAEVALAVNGTDAHPAAEEMFRNSIVAAKSMGALSWELRTSVSMARLLIIEGRESAALEALSPVYEAYSKEFSTVDTIAAKGILDQLQ